MEKELLTPEQQRVLDCASTRIAKTLETQVLQNAPDSEIIRVADESAFNIYSKEFLSAMFRSCYERTTGQKLQKDEIVYDSSADFASLAIVPKPITQERPVLFVLLSSGAKKMDVRYTNPNGKGRQIALEFKDYLAESIRLLANL